MFNQIDVVNHHDWINNHNDETIIQQQEQEPEQQTMTCAGRFHDDDYNIDEFSSFPTVLDSTNMHINSTNSKNNMQGQQIDDFMSNHHSCKERRNVEKASFLPIGSERTEIFGNDEDDDSCIIPNPKVAIRPHSINKIISDLSFNDKLIQQIHQLQQHLLLLQQQQQQQPQQQQNVPPQQQQQVPTKNPHTTSTFTSAAAPSSDINISDDYSMLEGNRPHSDPWVTRYQELQEFQAQFGHTIVPHNYTKSSSLAQWVKRQRNQRKRKLRGDNSCLTNVRELALDGLGFVWDAHAVSWEEHFNDLLDFKRKNGHCNVSSSYSENPKLSVWVKSQRRNYRLWEKGDTRSSMTRARFDRLNNIGFNWNPRNV